MPFELPPATGICLNLFFFNFYNFFLISGTDGDKGNLLEVVFNISKKYLVKTA